MTNFDTPVSPAPPTLGDDRPGTLWVTDSAARADRLTDLLKSDTARLLSWRYNTVIHTGGLLYGRPAGRLQNWSLSATGGLSSPEAIVLDRALGAKLERLAARAQAVFVCPVPGDMGEHWANEVALHLIPIANDNKMALLRFESLTEAGFAKALSGQTQLAPDRHSPIATRRLVDSYLRAMYSGPVAGRYLPFSRTRVLALLVLRARERTDVDRTNVLRIALQAPDQGPDFVGVFGPGPGKHPAPESLYTSLDTLPLPLPGPADIMEVQVASPPVAGLSELLRFCMSHLSMSGARIYGALRTLYSRGALTAPHEKACALSDEGIDYLLELGRLAGLRDHDMDRSLAARVESPPEAPRPTARVDVSRAGGLANAEDAVLRQVARRQLMALLPVRLQRVSPEALPGPLAGCRFERRLDYPWPVRRVETGLIQVPPARIILGDLLDSNLLSTSACVRWSNRLLMEGLIDNQVRLTEEGHAVLAQCPPGLREMGAHERLSQALMGGVGQSPAVRAGALLSEAGLVVDAPAHTPAPETDSLSPDDDDDWDNLSEFDEEQAPAGPAAP